MTPVCAYVPLLQFWSMKTRELSLHWSQSWNMLLARQPVATCSSITLEAALAKLRLRHSCCHVFRIRVRLDRHLIRRTSHVPTCIHLRIFGRIGANSSCIYKNTHFHVEFAKMTLCRTATVRQVVRSRHLPAVRWSTPARPLCSGLLQCSCCTGAACTVVIFLLF